MCKANRLDKVYLLFDVMEVKGLCDVVFYNIVIMGFCNSRYIKRVYKFFEEMFRKGVDFDVVIFIIFIRVFFIEGSDYVVKRLFD